jgi:uncharacterized protein YceH (UPF0502 family)
MTPELTSEECRVLGCLIEKERSTPEYYPLTLNALLNACNQKTNRDPVVQYDETTVEIALDGLHRKGLVSVVTGASLRVSKYLHLTQSRLDLDDAAATVMCILLLRGAQTVGEVRGRSGRMYDFAELSDVEAVLEQLTEREAPLVVRLPKLPGTKEYRYTHLLSGMPDISDYESGATTPHQSPSSALDELRSEVHQLREELDALKERFQALLDQLS